MVFYKQVLEFHRPSKLLCQTSGRQNHWSPLSMRLNFSLGLVLHSRVGCVAKHTPDLLFQAGAPQ
jgi:hypothetical protein